jgi:hypothetical protein
MYCLKEQLLIIVIKKVCSIKDDGTSDGTHIRRE